MISLIFMYNFLLMNIFIFIAIHPLSAGLILILNTISISILLVSLFKLFWFSYILILIFIGGMLILFIYMISLTPNKKFNLNMNFIIFSIMMLLLFFLNFMDPLILINYQTNFNNNLYMKSSTLKLFNSQSSFLTIMSISYLFFIMIIVTKITNSKKGPIRSHS